MNIFTFIIRVINYFKRFLNASKNLGFLIALKIFFFSNNNKINCIKSKNYPYKIYYRKEGDCGVLAHLYDLTYKISDANSDKKINTIIDLGANIGIETIKFSKFFPDAKIICIEPEISNFEILKKNTENYSNVFIENYAISNRETDIFIENISDPLTKNYYEGFRLTEKITNQKVRTITMQSLIKKHDLKKINILKSDIEGYEKYLFDDSCKDWLPLVDIIIFECPDNESIGAGITQEIYNQAQKNKLFYKSHICGENLVLINSKMNFFLDRVNYF